MLKQNLPTNVVCVVRPLKIRSDGISLRSDLLDDRRSDRPDRDTPADAAQHAELSAEAGKATGWWSAALPFLMEGFALYGASLHPNAAFPVEAMRRTASVRSPRPAGGQPLTEAFEEDGAHASKSCRAAEPGCGSRTDLHARGRWSWWAALGETAAVLLMHWRREREINRAVAALSSYDDRTLRDLGIGGRADIERVVRYCRDC
jgi:uncharacterized protein YjiS (DUF1127 family)